MADTDKKLTPEQEKLVNEIAKRFNEEIGRALDGESFKNPMEFARQLVADLKLVQLDDDQNKPEEPDDFSSQEHYGWQCAVNSLLGRNFRRIRR